jgi:hypothetical protein
MRMDGQLHVQAAIPQGNNTGTHLTGDHIGPRAGLDCSREEKMVLRLLPFEPQTVQPLAQFSVSTTLPVPAIFEISEINDFFFLPSLPHQQGSSFCLPSVARLVVFEEQNGTNWRKGTVS